MSPRLRAPIALAIAVAVGAIAGWCVKPAPAPPPSDPVVAVRDSALEQSQPKPPETFVEKVTRKTVKPVQVATSSGAPDTAAVADYCAPLLQRQRAFVVAHQPADASPEALETVTVPAADTARPTLPPFSGKFHGKRLELHSTLSNGQLWRATYDGIRLPVEWRSDGDTAWVEQERFWVRMGRGAARCGKRAAIGGALGGILGAALGSWKAGGAAGAAVGCASALD